VGPVIDPAPAAEPEPDDDQGGVEVLEVLTPAHLVEPVTVIDCVGSWVQAELDPPCRSIADLFAS
jgi:hypothetical protein